MDFHRFARWFRDSSPYIREHRDKVFVVLMPAASLQQGLLGKIVRDLALLHVLGIKQVLIVETTSGERRRCITTVKELFARGLPSSRYRNQAISVVEETFDSAPPIHHGNEPRDANAHRRKQADHIVQTLDHGSIALIAPTVGHSMSTNSHEETVNNVATAVALSISANKMIVLHEPASLVGDPDIVNSDLSTDAFQAILEQETLEKSTMHRMHALLQACRQGINRGHIVSYETEGALLAELFTADGSGTQISTDDYLTIRRATDIDTDVILDLMKMDIEQDRLVPRSREKLRDDSTTVFLAEHDNIPVGCVALYSLEDGMQEIGTLLAAPVHRDRNIGSRLLSRAEAEARKRGASHVFVFTRHAVDWFERHDYLTSRLDSLPSANRATYDHERQSTLLIKELE
ncbi:MAG: GNAT family N-acetyltransferase [Gammaproteobacteria bacterium]|nr:GNAT family N-acetyltransferase [Gammaproteobacteria bacterium]